MGCISFSRGSSQPRDQTYISCPFIGRQILYHLSHLGSPCFIYIYIFNIYNMYSFQKSIFPVLLFRDALFDKLITKCLLSQAGQGQRGFAGSGFGCGESDKRSWKDNNDIVSEETGCLECCHLLSTTHSKQEHHDKKATLKVLFGLKSRKGSDINNS